jgi:hypothetical protein
LVALLALGLTLLACDLDLVSLAGGSAIPTAAPPAFATPFLPVPNADAPGLSLGNPARIGARVEVGRLELSVLEVIRPADLRVRAGDSYPTLERGEQFLFVNVSVACRAPAGETCRVGELDFSLQDPSGGSNTAEFSMRFSGVHGLLETGEFASGSSRSGYLAFIVDQVDHGLTLVYAPLQIWMPGSTAFFEIGT